MNEKKDLLKLLKLIEQLDNHLYKMQQDETAFTVNDRLYDYLDDSSLYEWFDEQTEPVRYEISNRIQELI